MKRSQPIRILLYGAECTGKTTLGRALSEHYGCKMVNEYARDYAEYALPGVLVKEDAIRIARGQARAEGQALREAMINGEQVIIVDTDARMSWMYSELYFDETDPWIVHRSLHKRYDLIIFTAFEGIPWEPDPVRASRDPRYIQTNQLRYFLQMTAHLNEPLLPVSGPLEFRIAKAVKMIDIILENRKGNEATG